jgi:hypothetical protein
MRINTSLVVMGFWIWANNDNIIYEIKNFLIFLTLDEQKFSVGCFSQIMFLIFVPVYSTGSGPFRA